jgi:hypothetical protein
MIALFAGSKGTNKLILDSSFKEYLERDSAGSQPQNWNR